MKMPSPRAKSSTNNPQSPRGVSLGLLVVAMVFAPAHFAVAAEREPLRPNPDHQTFRVRIELNVEGNANLAKNPLVSRTRDLQVPLDSTASFEYDERVFNDGDAPNGHRAVASAQRYYREATATSKLNKSTQQISLRPSVSQAIVDRSELPERIYPSEGYLKRDELDLLRVPVSSISVDALLPENPIAQGERYQPDDEALAAVLNLTSIENSNVKATIAVLDDRQAKIHFKGNLDGSVDGVPAKLRLVGKLTFDREQGICNWLAMAIHETRDIGIAEPGFDVLAKIRLLRKPISASPDLTATARTATDRLASPESLYVDLQSDRLGFSALMDRRWRMMQDVPGAAMMRMVDSDRSVAQCDFRPLPSLDEGTQWTLEAFNEDVRRTLGDQLGEVTQAKEEVSATGLRVLRVAARGSAEGVPIEWIFLHFSDDSGRRMLATFTLASKEIDRFSGAEVQLAHSLQFAEIQSPERSGDRATAQTDSKGTSTRIADAISRDLERAEVQSASDARF